MRVSAKAEKPARRNAVVAGKLKVPADGKVVREETTELGRAEIARKEDKVIGTRETSGNETADRSSDVSDEQQYEDDFEVNIYNNTYNKGKKNYFFF